MSLIDSLQNRYKDRQSLAKVEIDGIEPFWFKPISTITPIQRSKVDKLHEQLSMDNAAQVLVYRAMNEDGTKMFKADDVDRIRNLTLSVDLEAMVSEMIRIDKEYEVEKKGY